MTRIPTRTMETTILTATRTTAGHPTDDNVVAAVQQRLAELGYYHGVIDGVVGPQTRTAINAYKANHGLVVDGTISRPLLDRMGLS